MINAVVCDLGAVLIFPKDRTYTGKLNPLHLELSKNNDYKFLDHFEINIVPLNYLKTLKNTYEIYIITEGTIQEVSELKIELDKVINEVFSAEKMGVNKKTPEAYTALARRIGKAQNELLFIDDNEENILAAKSAGLTTLLFKDNESLVSDLERLLR